MAYFIHRPIGFDCGNLRDGANLYLNFDGGIFVPAAYFAKEAKYVEHYAIFLLHQFFHVIDHFGGFVRLSVGGEPLANGLTRTCRRRNADGAIAAKPPGFARPSLGPDEKRFSILYKPNGGFDSLSIFTKSFDIQILLFFKLFKCRGYPLLLFNDVTSRIGWVVFDEGVWFYIAYDPQDEKISACGGCIKKAIKEKKNIAFEQADDPRHDSEQ